MNQDLKKIKQLQKKLYSMGKLDLIKSVEYMRIEAWECYLTAEREYLEKELERITESNR